MVLSIVKLVGKYSPKSIDNNAVWPFHEDFYIIMNLAVGGTLGGYIPDNINEATMEIDYVRYFSGIGEGNEGDNGAGNTLDEDNEVVNLYARGFPKLISKILFFYNLLFLCIIL